MSNITTIHLSKLSMVAIERTEIDFTLIALIKDLNLTMEVRSMMEQVTQAKLN